MTDLEDLLLRELREIHLIASTASASNGSCGVIANKAQRAITAADATLLYADDRAKHQDQLLHRAAAVIAELQTECDQLRARLDEAP